MLVKKSPFKKATGWNFLGGSIEMWVCSYSHLMTKQLCPVVRVVLLLELIQFALLHYNLRGLKLASHYVYVPITATKVVIDRFMAMSSLHDIGFYIRLSTFLGAAGCDAMQVNLFIFLFIGLLHNTYAPISNLSKKSKWITALKSHGVYFCQPCYCSRIFSHTYVCHKHYWSFT